MTEYIICYDITEPRRLGRIHRALKQYALPLQYSVFLFQGTAQQLETCLQRLAQLMDPHSDDIRAYPLPASGLRLSIGRKPLPNGVLLGSADGHWQATEGSVDDGPEDDDD